MGPLVEPESRTDLGPELFSLAKLVILIIACKRKWILKIGLGAGAQGQGKPRLAMGREAAPYEEFYGNLCGPISPLFLEG